MSDDLRQLLDADTPWLPEEVHLVRSALPGLLDRLVLLEAAAEAVREELAEKESLPGKSGVAYWAAQKENKYTEAIPGIGRRIRLARALSRLDSPGHPKADE